MKINSLVIGLLAILRDDTLYLNPEILGQTYKTGDTIFVKIDSVIKE